MYHAFALLEPRSEFTLPAAADRLKAKFPQVNVSLHGEEITLTTDNWDYHLLLQSGPDVRVESESFAGRIAGLDEDTPMRDCARRLEVWSDTPDPFMEHFDDHFQVLEVLRTFKGVILVDPHEPGLL
jgi:hypothetical protein